MDEIRVLTVSNEDWNEKYRIPEYVSLSMLTDEVMKEESDYDAVFVSRVPSVEETEYLKRVVRAYTLFIIDSTELSFTVKELFRMRKGLFFPELGVQGFFDHEIRNFHQMNRGEKINPQNFIVSTGFSGNVTWKGYSEVELDGDFGDQYHQIAYWKNTIPISKGQSLDMFLEFTKSDDVMLILSVTQYRAGQVAQFEQRWDFDKERLKEVFCIDNLNANGNLFISLKAKGKGKISIKGLHSRSSRRGYGFFIPGGEIYKTSSGEEVFCYFEPGDMKPPLNVYFAGYKKREGFEGYNLMRKLGCPFLLLSESRLEGGCFYMGDKEYEDLVKKIIRKYMDELEFEGNDVILSGMSMGTTGALYYSPDIRPKAIIIGKPLASIGDVATAELYYRPGGFPTSLDALYHIAGDTDEEAVKRLNDKLWDKFSAADYSDTVFVISYMIEDDYDRYAHDRLIEHLNSAGAKVYSRGLHGRHKDNTSGIVYWFAERYKQIIRDEFTRTVV